jgi:predicted alpha/beta superfamily hydrolase
MRNFLSRVMIACCVPGLLAVPAGAVNIAEPDMVQPELLPQGFVLVVEDMSRTATPDQPIYFASSINGWNPADPDYVLSPRSDTRWQIVIDKIPANTTIAFKVTMGGWDREELDESGSSIENRSLPKIDRSKLAPGERPVIEIKVPQFRIPAPLADVVRQSGPYRKLEVNGDVRRLPVQGGGGTGAIEALTRDLLVWLPPGYHAPENAGRAYPVLYLMDGQNVFEALPGLPGEWGVDETATELIEAGAIRPLIIVGVPHAGENRLTEYLPFGSIQGNEAAGPEFVAWMRREVMPRVERAFRVASGPENTGIGGASLGGAISLYAATQHPDVFGRVIVESLPLLPDNGNAARAYLDSVSAWPGKVFVGMGGREISNNERDAERNAMYRAWAEELDARLAAAGLGADDRRLRIDADANHNELAWAARFPEAVKFLFPAE